MALGSTNMQEIRNKSKIWLTLNLLIPVVIPLYGLAARGADLNYGSAHLLMGNPSSATDSTQNPSNYLMLKPQYALSYNRERNIPNWASWQLNDRWLGDTKRQDDFRLDPALPRGWYRVRPSDRPSKVVYGRSPLPSPGTLSLLFNSIL